MDEGVGWHDIVHQDEAYYECAHVLLDLVKKLIKDIGIARMV